MIKFVFIMFILYRDLLISWICNYGYDMDMDRGYMNDGSFV